ncbi:Gfo/Idh/MocA family protein [Calidifontibacter indicus]|uniref:Gfo/Idh/MocA family protein n=1 Tax=Calidifontibacter indicus TaxID=419650 RepID=UPI003D737765
MRIGLTGVGRIGAFHAATLDSLDAVDELVLYDFDAARAGKVAAELGARAVGSEEELLAAGIDGLVIATPTPGHAPMLRKAIGAGVATFCEKPVAATLDETIELTRLAESTDTPVHVGFQRRFDHGYQRVQRAVADGELGFIHTIRSHTLDQNPPHASYIPTSGGIFRDCNIHDFDVVRFVSGHEVTSVYATGGNQGADFFKEAGDYDTGGAMLTLDSGTVVQISSTRYNGQGHDVRTEVFGSLGSMCVGLDDTLAMVSAEEGVDWPRGPVHTSFMERFLPAYRVELNAFFEVVAGERPSPCTVRDALEAFRIAEACELSKAGRRVVSMDEVATA